MHRLAQFLTSWEATTFLVGEYIEEEIPDNPLFTMLDGIFWLSQIAERNSVVRKLRVIKLPGTEFCPRNLMTRNFRTTEFLSAICESQKMPSSMVKSGLSGISSSIYSPTRNVVASQLVRNWASRCMKDCTYTSPTSLLALRTSVRKES